MPGLGAAAGSESGRKGPGLAPPDSTLTPVGRLQVGYRDAAGPEVGDGEGGKRGKSLSCKGPGRR